MTFEFDSCKRMNHFILLTFIFQCFSKINKIKLQFGNIKGSLKPIRYLQFVQFHNQMQKRCLTKSFILIILVLLSRSSLLKTCECYLRKTRSECQRTDFATWSLDISNVFFFPTIVDVSRDGGRVGAFNERWGGRKEEEGHREERERSRCQTRNFAFTQRELIK